MIKTRVQQLLRMFTLFLIFLAACAASVVQTQPSPKQEQHIAPYTLEALEKLTAKQEDPQREAKAAQVIDQELTFHQIVDLWNEVRNLPEWDYLKPLLAYKLAKIYFHVRQYKDAKTMAQLVVDKFSTTPRIPEEAKQLLQLIEARFLVDTKTIGVVLPLSGKFKQYGERALAAIQLALADNSVMIMVRDSKGEAAGATSAVEELVQKHHVIAIIGPLFSTEATAAALKAEELDTPILTLSHQLGLPEIGPYVFRTALTVQKQAEALAKVAFEQLHYKRFAILQPRTPYGNDFVEAFFHEVEKYQGEVMGIETYNHDQTTFAEPIRKLVGRWYLNLRQDYREGMQAIVQQKLPSHKQKAAIESLEKSLPPIVDFDALVIPDTGRSIGLIGSALAFEDIVLSQNPDVLQKMSQVQGKEVKPVRLLGGSTWNSARIAESCERYCDNAIFVDAFFPSSNDVKVQNFITAFQTKTRSEPSLSEAQAYDTAGLLRAIINNDHPETREALLKILSSGIAYKGVTGSLRFDAMGEAQKDLFTLTIQERSIRLWEKSLESPKG